MIFKHTCLFCGSPCELTLAMSSENCTNPECRAFATSPKAVVEEATKKDLRASAKPVSWTAALRSSLLRTMEQPRDHYTLSKEFINKALKLRSTSDPAELLATLPCGTCGTCGRSDLRVIDIAGRPKTVMCNYCGSTYTNLRAENLVHDHIDITFTVTPHYPIKLLPPGTGFAWDKFKNPIDIEDWLAQSLLPKALLGSPGEMKTSGITTGRLRSDRPNESNTPKADYDVTKMKLSFGEALRFFSLYSRAPSLVARELKVPESALAQLREVVLKTYPQLTQDLAMLRRLRWPQTMRVMKRDPARGHAHNTAKHKLPCLGVLSFVDADEEASMATYDYIVVENTMNTQRARLIVTQQPVPYGGRTYGGVFSPEKKFTVLLTRVHATARGGVEEHLPFIAAEFEYDLARDRNSRNPTSAETALFLQMKKS